MSGGKLDGRVAIVTGGSRGLGREICVNLAAQGASVVVNYQGNEQAANAVVTLIKQQGIGKAIAVKGDVSVAADVIALFDRAQETFGHVNIVVNMAGILPDDYPSIEDMEEEVWDRVFSVNTKGNFLVCKEAQKRLIPGGRIVACSTSALVSLPLGYSAYVASKAAVEAFVKVLAKELRGKRITANCIAPGPVSTEMFYAGKTEETIASLVNASPFERIGEPQDVAAVVRFLVSYEAEWVNGQVIRINGGGSI